MFKHLKVYRYMVSPNSTEAYKVDLLIGFDLMLASLLGSEHFLQYAF